MNKKTENVSQKYERIETWEAGPSKKYNPKS